ncbi:hypothetical protein COOONC_08079 [Cooperia oncophora]
MLAIFTLPFRLGTACSIAYNYLIQNRRFIKASWNQREIAHIDPVEDEPDVRRFIDNYLKSDGVFVLRMLTLQSGVIFGTDLVVALWKAFNGIDENLKRSNSMPHVADVGEQVTTYWPPPPALNPARERMRNALGQNIDNSLVSQDILERMVPPYPVRRAPRYVAAVSAPVLEPEEYNEANEENEQNQALIRSLDSSPVKTAPPPTVVQRRAI